MKKTIIIALAVSAFSTLAIANQNDDILKCRDESDSLKRLTCYDALSTGSGNSTTVVKPAASPANIITTEIALRHQGKDFDRGVFNPRIEAVPTFKNNTKKTLVAVELAIVISDAFGEKIIDGKDKLDIKIAPGKSQTSNVFFYWEDNQFINNQPYDKLFGPVDTGVAKAEMKVLKAVFSDGSVEDYTKN
ncbi:hypothetical protein ACWF50_09745 [Brucella pseudogrignonensis]